MKEQMPIAVEFALKHHGDQEYGDSGLPYIYHLKCVDDLVIAAYVPSNHPRSAPYSSEPGDEIDLLRAVAFLHDVREDTEATIADMVLADICYDVIEAVIAISKVDGESYEDYMVKVMNNPLAHKVKICDTATNLAHSVLSGNAKRITKYSKQLNILKGFETV